MFIINEDNKSSYTVRNGSADRVVKNLSPGLYELKIERSMFGPEVKVKRNNRYDPKDIIKSGVYKKVTDHIDDFVSKEMYEIRNEMGLMHKLGIILNGGFGTGKTYLACQIAEKLAKEKNALGFITKGEPRMELAELVDMIRVDNPDQLIVLIMDEYEKFNSGETDMLQFLDGASSRNNIIVIATVNSVKSIPGSIRNRKGRIEETYQFDSESIEVIGKLVDNLIPEKFKGLLDKEKIVKEVMANKSLKNIDNISIHIRNLIYEAIKASNSTPNKENKS